MDNLGVLFDLYGAIVPDVRGLYRQEFRGFDRIRYPAFSAIDAMKNRSESVEAQPFEVMLRNAYNTVPVDDEVISTIERLVARGVSVAITSSAGNTFKPTVERICRHPVLTELPFVAWDDRGDKANVLVTADLSEAKTALRTGQRTILFVNADRLIRELALQHFL